uniref:Uncharacterized protein n=1 Tax=Schizaphis graminum TaxID=13262 RepID=A0A2S2P5Y4_SCHGA
MVRGDRGASPVVFTEHAPPASRGQPYFLCSVVRAHFIRGGGACIRYTTLPRLAAVPFVFLVIARTTFFCFLSARAQTSFENERKKKMPEKGKNECLRRTAARAYLQHNIACMICRKEKMAKKKKLISNTMPKRTTRSAPL